MNALREQMTTKSGVIHRKALLYEIFHPQSRRLPTVTGFEREGWPFRAFDDSLPRTKKGVPGETGHAPGMDAGEALGVVEASSTPGRGDRTGAALGNPA